MYDILDFVRRPMAIAEGARHIVCYVNSAFCSLAGRNKEEMIGKPIADILPEETKVSCFLTGSIAPGKSNLTWSRKKPIPSLSTGLMRSGPYWLNRLKVTIRPG